MRSIRTHHYGTLYRIRSRWAAMVFLCIAVLALSAAPAEKHLTVYSTAANYSLPIVQHEYRDYVGLLELLDPLGSVTSRSDPPRWRIHYNNVLGEFIVGKSHARIQGRDADLTGKFLLEVDTAWSRSIHSTHFFPVFWAGPPLFTSRRDVFSLAASQLTSRPQYLRAIPRAWFFISRLRSIHRSRPNQESFASHSAANLPPPLRPGSHSTARQFRRLTIWKRMAPPKSRSARQFP